VAGMTSIFAGWDMPWLKDSVSRQGLC